MGWWIAALAVVAFLALYAWWTARRLDRLHRRLDAAAAALDEQLVHRAEAAAASGEPALAAVALAAQATAGRLDAAREAAENALNDAILLSLAARGPAPDERFAGLLDEAARAAFARRFFNDAVRDVLVVRDRRVVRWGHLAGRAPRPAYLELDDGLLPVVPPVGRSAVPATET
jgi:hypothetical protein